MYRKDLNVHYLCPIINNKAAVPYNYKQTFCTHWKSYDFSVESSNKNMEEKKYAVNKRSASTLVASI